MPQSAAFSHSKPFFIYLALQFITFTVSQFPPLHLVDDAVNSQPKLKQITTRSLFVKRELKCNARGLLVAGFLISAINTRIFNYGNLVGELDI